MTDFLARVAAELYSALDGHFEDLTVVVPNKRTRLFLDDALARCAQPDHPLWAPRYATITELFADLSCLQPADELLCVVLLHRAFTQAMQEDETLEHFYAWGRTLLADFDDMDNNLVDVPALFANLQELEQLTATDHLSDEQVEAVKQFFSHFSENHLTEMKQHFLKLWEQLPPIYQRLHDELLQRHLAYPGMLKREVINSLCPDSPRKAEAATQTSTAALHAPALADTVEEMGSRTYAFVGFHRLSKSEQDLFDYLRQHARRTFTFTDGDDAEGSSAPSGTHPLPQAVGTGGERPTIITAPTDNAQARFAGEWLSQLHITSTSTLNRTAIVLCDEGLLPPLLHSLPDDLPINISMGFPLSQTPTGTLVTALLDLQRYGFAQGQALRTRFLRPILNHPLIEQLLTEDEKAEKLPQLRKVRSPFLSAGSLSPTLARLCTPQAHATDLLRWLIDIIEALGQHLVTDAPDSPSPWEEGTGSEALLCAHTTLTRLAALIQEHTLDLSTDLLIPLITHLLTLTHIPFSGEPATGIQVLGLLETRNLSFDNLLILSANEGDLPRRTISHSFIPYHLREAYGMSTRQQADELYQHHFYRLLAAARHTTILFNATPQSRRAGEPSRFVLQLLAAPASRSLQSEGDGEKLPAVQLRALQSPMRPRPSQPLSIESNDDIHRLLRERYDTSYEEPSHPPKKPEKKRALSPSAINTYINCSLKFYFHYVARLHMEDDTDEQVPDNIFGTAFHNAMEHIYQHHFVPNTVLQASQLEDLAQQDATLAKIVSEAFAKANNYKSSDNFTGEQQLNISILVKYVQQQLRADAQLTPLTIHATENQEESYLLHVNALGGTVKLGGIIDRRDTITYKGDTIQRIVDYKTSISPQEARTSIDQLFDANQHHRPYHLLQALYYADIYTHNHPDEQVAPAIAYVKKECEPIIHIAGTPLDDYARNPFRPLFHDRLLQTINALFDPNASFTPTAQEDTCQRCPYTKLCGRKKKKAWW